MGDLLNSLKMLLKRIETSRYVKCFKDFVMFSEMIFFWHILTFFFYALAPPSPPEKISEHGNINFWAVYNKKPKS